MKRHTKKFGLLPFALLPSFFSLCPVTSLRHFLIFHPSNLYSLLSLFPLSLCAFVFSYICLFQASLVLFTSTTFSVLLGQPCGFGACNKPLYKIPNYASHFKTMRTAGRAHPVTLQQWPVCLKYNQPSSTNRASASQYVPSAPPQLLCVPQRGLSWRWGPWHPPGLTGYFFPSLAQSLLESIQTFSSHTAHVTGKIRV